MVMLRGSTFCLLHFRRCWANLGEIDIGHLHWHLLGELNFRSNWSAFYIELKTELCQLSHQRFVSARRQVFMFLRMCLSVHTLVTQQVRIDMYFRARVIFLLSQVSHGICNPSPVCMTLAWRLCYSQHKPLHTDIPNVFGEEFLYGNLLTHCRDCL
jgi:hypothetical protein